MLDKHQSTGRHGIITLDGQQLDQPLQQPDQYWTADKDYRQDQHFRLNDPVLVFIDKTISMEGPVASAAGQGQKRKRWTVPPSWWTGIVHLADPVCKLAMADNPDVVIETSDSAIGSYPRTDVIHFPLDFVASSSANEVVLKHNGSPINVIASNWGEMVDHAKAIQVATFNANRLLVSLHTSYYKFYIDYILVLTF
jgi:hypothetical protein